MPGNFITSIEDRVLLRLAAFRREKLFGSDPVEQQEMLLARLLKANKDTAFGREFDFASIRSSREFLERVPSCSYRTLNPWIERVLGNEKDVLFSGRPVCFGTTSGTEGLSKLIPYNQYVLNMTRMSAVDASLIAGLEHGSMRWYRSKALYIGPRKAYQHGEWQIYSEGTAFIYLQAALLRRHFVPQYSDLPGRHEKPDYGRISDCIRKHRIQFIAGNPLEIVEFVSATGTVMPDVSIVSNCGFWAVEQEPVYRRAFPNATIVDMYGSNEGILGLPVSLGRFLLNYGRVFFSFIPMRGGEQAIGLNAVILGRKYKMCITTPGGLWNYHTGDIVCFGSIRPPAFSLCGRCERAVPLEDKWLTENEVVDAVQQAYPGMQKYHLRPDKRGYVLCVEQDRINADTVDQNLCRMNLAYAHARKSGILGKLIVRQERIGNITFAKPARIKTDSR